MLAVEWVIDIIHAGFVTDEGAGLTVMALTLGVRDFEATQDAEIEPCKQMKRAGHPSWLLPNQRSHLRMLEDLVQSKSGGPRPRRCTSSSILLLGYSWLDVLVRSDCITCVVKQVLISQAWRTRRFRRNRHLIRSLMSSTVTTPARPLHRLRVRTVIRA